ncbi:MAG: nucleotide pyrophosphohydrolase [Candidatus Heimdallarchaeota archaeon]|nr:MAG: nucleotide pyrophosphohydrolase [Candidatus Heimdallarchaeota archaeon]
MNILYGDRDRKRGTDRSLIHLQTEIGELLEAYLKGDLDSSREEVADVFAWLCSVCNLLNIDLETVAYQKYPHRCPKCDANPCECHPL